MQIRTLLLIISLLGSALTAITVWVVSAQREAAQMQADSELRWQIYSDSWQRLESAELLELDKYGSQGKNQSFWRAENADPLASSTSVPIYSSDVDYSTAGIDSIANPVIKGIIEQKGSSRQANGLLRRFFGAPLQRGKVLFYSVVQASDFEQIICKKSLFARAYDPCSAKFQASFEGVGSRMQLYDEIVRTGTTWSGYMRQKSTTSSEYNLITASPIMVGSEVKFILIVAAPLPPVVKRFGEEFNLDVSVIDLANDIPSTDATSLASREFMDLNPDKLFGILQQTKSSFVKLPLNNEAVESTLWLALTNDITGLIDQKNTYTCLLYTSPSPRD